MQDDDKPQDKPRRREPTSETKEDRLAKALRENLRRRKAKKD
ncbi:MAG: hypothetical protein AAGI89_08355 [Pseudomonadota bacterium]